MILSTLFAQGALLLGCGLGRELCLAIGNWTRTSFQRSGNLSLLGASKANSVCCSLGLERLVSLELGVVWEKAAQEFVRWLPVGLALCHSQYSYIYIYIFIVIYMYIVI